MYFILKSIMLVIGISLGFLLSLVFIPLGYLANKIGRFYQVSLLIAYIPFYLGEYTRYFYYKILLNQVGKKVIFSFGSYCQYRDVEIGNNCLIGNFNSLGQVKIGNDVLIGGYVNFTSGLKQHSFDNENKKIRDQHGERRTIVIGSDSWIGNNSIICADVGERSVVGVGSLVISTLEGNGIFVGSPAKKIKEI